jgi:hypothetical protein
MKFKFSLILIKIFNLDTIWNLYSHHDTHVHVRIAGGGIGSSSYPVTDFRISSAERQSSATAVLINFPNNANIIYMFLTSQFIDCFATSQKFSALKRIHLISYGCIRAV